MARFEYDPHNHSVSAAWPVLEESERMRLVERYHRKQRIRLPNLTIHAAIHVMVENQVALGEQFPVRAVLLRLMEEGLDRHEAIHAIGSVLSEELFAAMRGEHAEGDPNVNYAQRTSNDSQRSPGKPAF